MNEPVLSCKEHVNVNRESRISVYHLLGGSRMTLSQSTGFSHETRDGECVSSCTFSLVVTKLEDDDDVVVMLTHS